MWIEERLRLTVSHHHHGVKPPVPEGTGLPSLHRWGFLFLHLKSKPGPDSQQSSTPSLPPLPPLSLSLPPSLHLPLFFFFFFYNTCPVLLSPALSGSTNKPKSLISNRLCFNGWTRPLLMVPSRAVVFMRTVHSDEFIILFSQLCKWELSESSNRGCLHQRLILRRKILLRTDDATQRCNM